MYAFGVFFKPLSQDYHAGRGKISFAFTLQNLAAALCAPLIGRLIDRLGARSVILPGTGIFGLLLLSSKLLGGRLPMSCVCILHTLQMRQGEFPAIVPQLCGGSPGERGFRRPTDGQLEHRHRVCSSRFHHGIGDFQAMRENFVYATLVLVVCGGIYLVTQGMNLMNQPSDLKFGCGIGLIALVLVLFPAAMKWIWHHKTTPHNPPD